MIFEKQILQYYKGLLHTRYDGDGMTFYFQPSDFDGLIAEPIPFKSAAGHTLSGYLYHYEPVIPGRIVVFDHGIGGGHRAYMKEIEMLCRRGYLVFAYDHTGCMESGGETANGLAQSLCDLDACMRFIKENERFRGLDISVMGHSWGGFSTLNIAALHPEISHIVVLSGFVSVEMVVADFFTGFLKAYRKAVYAFEARVNPDHIGFHGVESLSKTDAKVLLVYSDNDHLVNVRHYECLKAGLADRPNVTFRLEQNKGHNPNYTQDAIARLGEYHAAKKKLTSSKKPVSDAQKNAFRDSFDWDRMTAQDAAVWEEVFACLER